MRYSRKLPTSPAKLSFVSSSWLFWQSLIYCPIICRRLGFGRNSKLSPLMRFPLTCTKSKWEYFLEVCPPEKKLRKSMKIQGFPLFGSLKSQRENHQTQLCAGISRLPLPKYGMSKIRVCLGIVWSDSLVFSTHPMLQILFCLVFQRTHPPKPSVTPTQQNDYCRKNSYIRWIHHFIFAPFRVMEKNNHPKKGSYDPRDGGFPGGRHGWCYARSWGWGGVGVGWGGVGMITFLALAHMVGATQHHLSCTCTHGRCYATSWDGVGVGWGGGW